VYKRQDFDRAEIKQESEPALREIARLLRDDPQLSVHVVGHTDNVGDLEYNMDLSRRRADAVVAALAERHGIARTRLTAAGVGPLAPVAPNTTLDGRAKKRRVELVEQ
jgi:outer membrane protein OmpA-like peptidoglycan-associated protein